MTPAYVLFLALAIAQPQEETPPVEPKAKVDVNAAAVDKLAPFAFLLGEWSGEGWTGSLKLRNAFRMDAKADSRFGGRVISIQAVGRATSPNPEKPGPLHEILGLLSWDAKTESLRMRVIRTDGGFVDANVEAGDKKLVWWFEPGGSRQIRHTITLNDKGQWHEIGELSRDRGKTWVTFLDLTLDKKAPAGDSGS